MQIQGISTARLGKFRQVSCINENTLITASEKTLTWYQVVDTDATELRSCCAEGRVMGLFTLPGHSRAVFHRIHDPEHYFLQVVDEHGCQGSPIAVPFYWISQMTADASGSLLAVFGAVSLPGQLPPGPTQSCLINLLSGNVQQFPYSAIAIKGYSLYYVKDLDLYKRSVYSTDFGTQSPDSGSSSSSAEILATCLPEHIIALAFDNQCIWLVTNKALFEVMERRVIRVHQWGSRIGRVRACNDVFFAIGMASSVFVYDARTGVAMRVHSSQQKEVTGFDTVCPHNNGDEKGLLVIASGDGLLERFSWDVDAGR